MNRSSVPKQDQVSSYVLQEITKKEDDLLACNVIRVQVNIETHAVSSRRNRNARNSGDSISFVAMPQDRSFTRRGPRPADVGNEQETAFVEECQMGPKSCGFFLSRAMWSSSIVRLPSRHAGSLDVPASDNSTPTPATSPSKHDRCGSVRQTPSRSTVRCVVRSTVRWSIQWRRVLAVGSFSNDVSGSCVSAAAVPGLVLAGGLSAHFCGRPDTNERQNSGMKQPRMLPSEMSFPVARERPPGVSDFRAVHLFHGVSCPTLQHNWDLCPFFMRTSIISFPSPPMIVSSPSPPSYTI
jgi:hypothetical protein